MTVFTSTTRNATAEDLVALLKDRQARKLDIVVSATAMRAKGGHLVVKGAEKQITLDGVTDVDGTYLPTTVMDEGFSSKLGIQLSYMRRLRAERPDLWDANVNGWLHGKSVIRGGERDVIHAADERSFLLRLFRGDDGVGVGRALLSDRFARIEDLDVLLTTLQAIQQMGVKANIVSADVSDRRMYVRIEAPEVAALAPELLKNYRSPFTGESGADNPVVFAGLEISNSEVGNGAFSITPRMVVQVCTNGMKVTKDVVRAVHLGGKLDEGVIAWTEETQRKALDLIMAKTKDAVRTFLDQDYMTRVINGMTETAQVAVTDPAETLKVLSKTLTFDDATAAGVLDHFIKGGDVTAGGVLHAVTSFAQTVADADAAADLEASAFKAMELAASAQR